MTFQNFLKASAATATVLALNPGSVLAVNPDTANIDDISTAFDPLTGYRPSGFIRTALNLLLGVAGVVSFIFLLWGGLQWILAGGDKEGTEKARKKITAALIGLAIVFSAYALIYILKALFNIEILQVDIRQIGTAT